MTAHHTTLQPSTSQHIASHRSTAQHSTAQLIPCLCNASNRTASLHITSQSHDIPYHHHTAWHPIAPHHAAQRIAFLALFPPTLPPSVPPQSPPRITKHEPL
ncbi:unnamed protein product [Closterium sp. NIES-54]